MAFIYPKTQTSAVIITKKDNSISIFVLGQNLF